MVKNLNPLSDFWFSPKDGHRFTESEAKSYHIAQFAKDVYKVDAIDENLKKIRLGEPGATDDKVDMINGQWHIQNNFPHKISIVRKKAMVLLKKLDYTESTNFEYWTAKTVGYNCFGPFINKSKDTDYIVAKYETDDEIYWGYGETLESARAYCGLKVYDVYKDIIHRIACRKKLNVNQK